MTKRVIAVFTGNRAEYGLQFPILSAIKNHPDLDYRLIVSGAHLDGNFGQTKAEIADDGFEIHAEVAIGFRQDDLLATAHAIGSGVASIADVLSELGPDALLVYADRFEGFAAVIAGTQTNVVTGHIEGGDITEGGALDDSVRHAMTKLSHLHFTTNQQATNRVLAMGEEAWRVHTVGFPALDLVRQGRFSTASEVVDRLELDLSKPVVLFTQHSVTTEFDQVRAQIGPSLKALAELARGGVQVIVTWPNNDAGGRQIIAELEAFAPSAPTGIQMHKSLGRYLYHGVLALSRDPNIRVACVGNSSSGIKETPIFGCPTVNIGSRQDGRLRGENVLDVGYDAEQIMESVDRCLNDHNVRERCRNGSNPYGGGDAGIKIAETMARLDLGPHVLRKRMNLAGEEREGWYR